MSSNLLPYILISAFVAIVDILPLLFKSKPWRYSLAMFFQVLALGMVVFCFSPTIMPWWAVGLTSGFLLILPHLILPPMRGAYEWYVTLMNSLVIGLFFALVKHSLSSIATYFT